MLVSIIVVNQSAHHFPPPWTVQQIPVGFKVLDAKGRLAYAYGRESKADADIAITMDEARVTSNIAKVPTFLSASPQNHD